MKSIFLRKPVWILLLLTAIAVTTGVTLAKYAQTFTGIGTFSVSVKKEEVEVFAVLAATETAGKYSLEFFEDKTEIVEQLENDITANATATYTYTTEESVSVTKTVSKVYRHIETTQYNRRIAPDSTGSVSGKTNPGWSSSAANILKVVFHTKVQPVSTSGWFAGFKNCDSFENLTNLDTVRTTTMESMFYNCSLLSDSHLENWNIDTAGTTNVATMFRGCIGLIEPKLNFINSTNNVVLTDLRAMFRGCTQNVSGTLYGLVKLDLSSLQIASEEVNLAYMFYRTESMTEVEFPEGPVYSFNKTADIKGTSHMFYECQRLKEVNIGFIKTRSSSALEMFYNCKNIKTIYVDEEFAISYSNEAGTNTAVSMFMYCTKLVGGNGTSAGDTANLDAPNRPTYHNSIHARIDGHEGMGGYFTAADHDQVEHADVKVTVDSNAGFKWTGVKEEGHQGHYVGGFIPEGQHAFFANSTSSRTNVLTLEADAGTVLPNALNVTIDGALITVYDGETNSTGVKYNKAAGTLTVPANLMHMYQGDTTTHYENTIQISAGDGEALDFTGDSDSVELAFNGNTATITFSTSKAATVTAEPSPEGIATAAIESEDDGLTHTATLAADNTVGNGTVTFTAETAGGEIKTHTVTVSVESNGLSVTDDSHETLKVAESGNVTVNGGKITDLTVNGGGTATIYGGTVRTLSVKKNAQVTVEGGNVNTLTVAEDAAVTITGGTFGFEPNAEYISEGYAATDNGDETWTVSAAQDTADDEPNEPECECTVNCTQEAFNADCPVCSLDPSGCQIPAEENDLGDDTQFSADNDVPDEGEQPSDPPAEVITEDVALPKEPEEETTPESDPPAEE